MDEPSVVALDRRTDKMIAVGERAKMMYEKEIRIFVLYVRYATGLLPILMPVNR